MAGAEIEAEQWRPQDIVSDARTRSPDLGDTDRSDGRQGLSLHSWSFRAARADCASLSRMQTRLPCAHEEIDMLTIDGAGTFALGDRTIRRLGYGAMRLAGPGVFGPPKDRAAALAVL